MFHKKKLLSNVKFLLKSLFNDDSPYFNFYADIREKLASQIKDDLDIFVDIDFKSLNYLSFTLNSSIDFRVEVRFNKENFVEISHQDIDSVDDKIEAIKEQVHLLDISLELLKEARESAMLKPDYKKSCYYALEESEKVIMLYLEKSNSDIQRRSIVDIFQDIITAKKYINKLRPFSRKRIKIATYSAEKKLIEMQLRDEDFLKKLNNIRDFHYDEKKKLLKYIKEEYRKNDFMPISTNIKISR